MEKIIVVNNPAAREGGALTILKNFLEKISSLNCNRKFYIFVSLKELKQYEKENIKIIILNKQNFKERIIWDNYKFKNFLKKENIKSDICISLQNTGLNLEKNIPQILYYHQPLSLVNLKWNFFNREERIYWQYEKIYPFFIKLHLKKVKKIIVQTNWVKESFSKKFNYKKGDIYIDLPKLNKIDVEKIGIIPREKYRIFYPAASYAYKNHEVIVEALKGLKEHENKIECIFTIDKGENLKVDHLIKNNKLENIVKLIGKIPHRKVLEYYKNSDLLVFPSKLETLGLPLLEAQQFNLEILAIDYEYAREATKNYKKIKYILNDSKIWKKYLEEFIKRKGTDVIDNNSDL